LHEQKGKRETSKEASNSKERDQKKQQKTNPKESYMRKKKDWGKTHQRNGPERIKNRKHNPLTRQNKFPNLRRETNVTLSNREREKEQPRAIPTNQDGGEGK